MSSADLSGVITKDARTLTRLPRDLRRALVISASILIALTAVASLITLEFVPTSTGPRFVWLTAYFFQVQDRPWLIAMAILFLGLAFTPLPPLPDRVVALLRQRPRAVLGLLALGVFAVGIVGTDVVFHGYHLTRDEFLAEFDATTLRSGRFVAPIAAQWQPFASALAPEFMLPIPADVGFASDYLPVNAGFRTIVGLFADPACTNPLLAVAAILAIFGVARRLWPERRDTAFVSVILAATSSQVLITAMTSYAMTAHLALNMIWLWLFLRNDRIGHGGAIATGWLAAGLHQLIFHPLFVAPFIVRLWSDNRRQLALVYAASYALICAFWIGFSKLALSSHGAPALATDTAGPVYFIYRVVMLVTGFQWSGADLMLKNLLRFAAWQSPALLPLVLLALPVVRRGSGISRELFAGLALTLVAMFLLLPYQGHGWGYRYLHGLIGSAVLLAGYGWLALTERCSRDDIGVSKTMLAICGLLSAFLLLPVHAIQARDFVRPYARAADAIAHAQADVVIVDQSHLLSAKDLVRNDPFLRNRPKVLALTNLKPADIDRLCASNSVVIFDRSKAKAFGIGESDHATPDIDAINAQLRNELAQRGCGSAPGLNAPTD